MAKTARRRFDLGKMGKIALSPESEYAAPIASLSVSGVRSRDAPGSYRVVAVTRRTSCCKSGHIDRHDVVGSVGRSEYHTIQLG